MDKENLKGVAALLVHVARVDEAYTYKEKQIIKSFINSFNESDGELILKEAEELESNSNQLLSFTRAVKDQELEVKKEIIEHLWQIIKSFINSFNESDGDLILREAEELESNSNQLLSFTRAVKDQELEVKKEIIEHLWKIIISDQNVDHYESNLMRRICGLIYFPDKLCGEIKLKVLKSN